MLAYFAVLFAASAQIAPSSLSREQPSPSPTPTPAPTASPKVEITPATKPEEKPAPPAAEKSVPKTETKSAQPRTNAPAADEERPAGAGADTASKLQQLEREWEASPRNTAVIERIVADDFIGVTSDGKIVSKRALLKGSSKEKGEGSSSIGHMDVRLHGAKVAVIIGIARETITNRAGKRSTTSYRVLDTWIERNGQWQCIASQMTTLRSGGAFSPTGNSIKSAEPLPRQVGSYIPRRRY